MDTSPAPPTYPRVACAAAVRSPAQAATTTAAASIVFVSIDMATLRIPRCLAADASCMLEALTATMARRPLKPRQGAAVRRPQPAIPAVRPDVIVDFQVERG